MSNQLQTINQKEMAGSILNRINEMTEEGLALPKNYNAANALQIAFLKLVDMKVKGQNLLDVVTKKSVYESLLNMVLQGLSPAKNQVYFVPYGNQLQMQRSYFGTQTALKRLDGIKEIWANVIYEGDEFDIDIDENGQERFLKHETHWKNRDNPIEGAYAIIQKEDGEQSLTVMTKKEIDKSWSQAKTKKVHENFGQEMAKRTVINRAAKSYLNTSDDSDLLVDAINQTTKNEYDEEASRHDVTESAKSDTDQALLKALEEAKKEEEVTPPTDEEEDEAEFVDADFEEVEEKSNNDDLETLKKERDKYLSEQEKSDGEDIYEQNDEGNDIDWSKFTADQIKSSLDKNGIEYSHHDRKDDLIRKAEEFLGGGEQVELL